MINIKISLYVPQGNKNALKFLKNELAEAQSIKNKQNRKSVIRALTKLTKVFRQNVSGLAAFAGSDELKVEHYSGRKQIYYCGKEYKQLEVAPNLPQLLVVVDANEATIGQTDGENIKVMWTEQSLVPRKHGKGGQSAQRFERAREQALKAWLRKVVDKVKGEVGDRKIIIGGPGMTKDQFRKELPV